MNHEVNENNSETKSQPEEINSEIRSLGSRITEGYSAGENADLRTVEEYDNAVQPSLVSAERLNHNNVNDSSIMQCSCRSETCSVCEEYDHLLGNGSVNTA
jgi:hypothetical protein